MTDSDDVLIDFATPALAITRAIADRLEDGHSDADALFERQLEVAANDLATQIRARAPDLALRAEADRRQHRDAVLRQWGPALDLYTAFTSIAESCLIETFARREHEACTEGVDPDPRLRVLAGLQARMCRVGLEVHELTRTGHRVSLATVSRWLVRLEINRRRDIDPDGSTRSQTNPNERTPRCRVAGPAAPELNGPRVSSPLGQAQQRLGARRPRPARWPLGRRPPRDRDSGQLRRERPAAQDPGAWRHEQ